MAEYVEVTGIVIGVRQVGEYDKVLTILTRERGKISAFARNSRRQNSRLMAAANLFCTGKFHLYPGKNAYSITDASVSDYFEQLHMDPESAYYGMYFSEVADFYTRENNDDADMMELLYRALRTLTKDNFSKPLIRAVFECKAMAVNGEFPGAAANPKASDACRYTLDFLLNCPLSRTFSFTLSDEVLQEVIRVSAALREKIWNHHFKTEDFL